MTLRVRIPKVNNELYLGILLMVMKVFLSSSRILFYNDTIDDVLSLAAAALFVLHILRKRYTLKRLIIYAVITLLSLYSAYITGQNAIMITVITVLAVPDSDFDRILSFMYQFERFFLIAHTVFAVMFHLFASVPLSRSIDGVVRAHFGLVHPNVFSIYVFNLILMWIWLNYERITAKSIAYIGGLGFLVFFFTKTRTFFLALLFVLVFLLFSRKKNSFILKTAATYIVPVLSVLFFVLIKGFTSGSSVIALLDRLLVTRVRLGAYAYERYGISFFGQDLRQMKVVWDSFWRISGHTFDCIYTYLMVEMGAIWLALIAFCFFRLSKRSDNKINLQLIAWGLYGICEVHGINVYMCFPLLLLVFLIAPGRTSSVKTTGGFSQG